MNICIYGASSDKINDIYIKTVEDLGEKMAKRGHTLVFGAGSGGCMGASARGAARGHGEIIGIAPSFFEVDGVLYPHCTKFIETKTMRERKQMLEDYSDAFILSPGGIGSLDEFFEIITLKQLDRHAKAIVIFNINHYYDDLQSLLEKMADEKFMQPETLELVKFFTDSDEILDYIESYHAPKIVVSNMKHI